MTRRPSRCFRPLVALFIVATLNPALLAQTNDDGRERPATATLPESNEALLLSGRIEQAVQAGDYRLAIELLEQMVSLPGGLVAAPASRTYYPVWRQAFRLLAQLPAPGVALYRQLHDAEVSARFQEAVAAVDLNALRELFRNYRLTSVWGAIGVELAARLLDQGAYGEAIEVLREMSLAGVDATPEHKAQLAVALASAGALRPAERLLAELEADSALDAQPEWRARLEQLRRWITARRTGESTAAAEHWRPFAPHIEAGAVWAQPLPLELRPALVDEDDDIAEAIDIRRRLPLHCPVLAKQTLVVRLHGTLWAFDARTLLPEWSVAESLGDDAVDAFASVEPDADREKDVRLSSDAELLLSNYLRHAVSTGFGKVYTVEGFALFDADFEAFGQRPFRVAREALRRNELVARELHTGRLVWRTALEAAGPLFDVAFQNVPIAVGDALVVPIQRGRDLNLAVLDPGDGRLLREVPLVGPPTRFPHEGGRCPIASDETTLYVCTGNGVIAALARDDLTWKWATVYPSTLAEHLGQWWWQPPRGRQEGGLDLPVIADDLLIVAPVDSDPPQIFALDRFSGRECWRIQQREYPFLIGVLSEGLVLGGHAVTCLDLADPVGRPPRWKSVPLQITGRAVIRDDRVYVPAREGIIVLDGRTGKVLADQVETAPLSPAVAASDQAAPAASSTEPPAASARLGPAECTANLLISDDALFSVSPGRVVKYPDLRRARARCAALEEGEAGADRTELVQAWLDTLEGRYRDAFARLQARPFADTKVRAGRDQLLTYVFLGLAQHAPAGAERLSWLQQAATVADSPQSAARLAITIGRALEEGGRWREALRHYGELLRQADGRYVTDVRDAHRRVADWLHAAERIGALCPRVPDDLVEELLRQTQRSDDGEEGKAVALQRLRVALADEPVRERLDQLLTLQKLSPELKIQYLPKGDRDELPAALRRRLHLERWDTHVSLGWLDQSRKDRAVWYSQFADSDTSGAAASQPVLFVPLGPQEELERVGAIDLALRKLEQAVGNPFSQHVTRQWKIERAELLLDPHRPLSSLRPWVLAADLENHRIALVNAYKHQHPQRQTEDGLIAARLEQDPRAATFQPAAAGRRFGSEQGWRSTWPMVVHEQLAVVPVAGGLVCVGLGPERYAGRRQWEYPVPEWGDIPAGFADRAVAGPQGVFFAPRRDRVVLVGWLDGHLWWQRDLPGATIARLCLSGDRLVIVGDDRRAWVTDATSGRDLRPVETEIASPRRIDVVGDTIVVWGSKSVVGLTSETLQPLWVQPCAPVGDSVTVSQCPWIAYRARGERAWYLLDVRGGELVFDAPLGTFDSISAIVADAGRLFVAGCVGSLDEDEKAPLARVVALDLADATEYWSQDFVTPVAVNATQLAAHPDTIPILLAPIEDGGDSDDPELPALQLVDKHSGEPGERFSIRSDYQPFLEASCGMYMLVTPTRMIVQVRGNLIAYGNSPLRSAP